MILIWVTYTDGTEHIYIYFRESIREAYVKTVYVLHRIYAHNTCVFTHQIAMYIHIVMIWILTWFTSNFIGYLFPIEPLYF